MPFFNVGEVRVATDEDVSYVIQMCEDFTGWTEEYKKGELSIYSKANSLSELRMFKIKNRMLDVPAEVLYDVLHDSEYRKEWDKGMIETYELCKLDVNNDIGYYAVKAMIPFTNRDLVLQRSWLKTEDYYVIFNHSVFHKKLPPRKNFIRAITYFGAYYIRPLSPTSCEIIYMAQTDPRGKLPTWAVNKFTRFVAPRLAHNMHKAARSYPAWKAKHRPEWKPWIDGQSEIPRLNLDDILTKPDYDATCTVLDETNVDEPTSSLEEEVPKLKTSKSGDNLISDCNGNGKVPS